MKIGLNVGSGQRPFTTVFPEVEWINVDAVRREGYACDLICDGAHLPYGDGEVDYFVLHHVLEHFGCGEGRGLVEEANRVLKVGGSLFVFVPNIAELAARWLRQEMDTQLFMTNVYGAYISGEEESRHKWGFTGPSLSDFLWSSAKWSGMGAFDWRPIPGADFERDWWVLAAECVK